MGSTTVEIKKEGDKQYFVISPSPDSYGHDFFVTVRNSFSGLGSEKFSCQKCLNPGAHREIRVPESASYLLPTDSAKVDQLVKALQAAIAFQKVQDPLFWSDAEQKSKVQHRDVALRLLQEYADSIKSTTASVKTVASSSETTTTTLTEKTLGAATAPATPLTTGSMFATGTSTCSTTPSLPHETEEKPKGP